MNRYVTPADFGERFGVSASAIRRRLRSAPVAIRNLGRRRSRGRWQFESADAERVEQWLLESFGAAGDNWLLVTFTGPDPHTPPAAQLLDSARALVGLHATIQHAVEPDAHGVLLISRIRYGSPVELRFLIDLVVANHEAIATWLQVVLEVAGLGLGAETLRRSSRGSRLPEPRSTRQVEEAAREAEVLEDYVRDRITLEAGPLRIERVRTRRITRRERQ